MALYWGREFCEEIFAVYGLKICIRPGNYIGTGIVSRKKVS